MKTPQYLLDEWMDHYKSEKIRFDLGSSTGPACSFKNLLKLLNQQERDELDSLLLVYGAARGSRRLRELIAEDHHVNPEQVLVVTGASEALHLIFFDAAEPGANVIIPSPCFPAMEVLPQVLGIEVRQYPLHRNEGFKAHLQDIERLIDSNTKMLVVNSPHNPTGAVLTDNEMLSLYGLAEARGIQFVSDEVYFPLYEGVPTQSASALTNATVVRDLSKALPFAGLRIGWIVERNKERLERYLRTRMYFTISNNVLGEQLATAVMARRNDLLRETRIQTVRNLKLLVKFMKHNEEHLGWAPPGGGTVCFPWIKFGIDSRPLCKAFADSGVLVIPGDCFGSPDHMRIGFGKNQEFKDALELLQTALDKFMKTGATAQKERVPGAALSPSDNAATPSVAIRRATSEDKGAILACLRRAFQPFRSQYTSDAFRDTVLTDETIGIRLQSMTVFVAVASDATVVGTIGCQLVDKIEGHIRGMAVHPAWQGLAVADQLLETAEREISAGGCTRITLDTTQPLQRAIAFYERHGFVSTGRISSFFGMALFEYKKDLKPAKLSDESFKNEVWR